MQPPYHGIYSHAVEAAADSRTVHISGQIGLDRNGVVAEGFEAGLVDPDRLVEIEALAAAAN